MTYLTMDDEKKPTSVIRPSFSAAPELFSGYVSRLGCRAAVESTPPVALREKLEKGLRDAEPLYKRILPETQGREVRFRDIGVIYHPFSMDSALAMRECSPHHGACIETLVDLTVGAGLKDESLYAKLDPLTAAGFDQELRTLARSYFELGQAYLEVVRRGREQGAEITALYSQPAERVLRVQHGRSRKEQHFLYSPYLPGVYMSGHNLASWTTENQAMFACFGGMRRLRRLRGTFQRDRVLANATGTALSGEIGELIDFVQPSSRWEHYGEPKWFGLLPTLEIAREHQRSTQLYFANRASTDRLISIIGQDLTDEQVNGLRDCLNATSGDGQGKSVVLAFSKPSSDVTVQVDQVTEPLEGESYREFSDTIALYVCSGHRIPPSLAGISTNRSLGSSNELTQALVILQMISIAPVQRALAKRLALTLGDGTLGVEGCAGNKFELKPVLEMEEMTALNEMARSRQADSSVTRATEGPGLRR